MSTAYFVNPDTLRIPGAATGLVRLQGEGIQVDVLIYEGNIPVTIGQYIQRAIDLFNTFPVIDNSTEPDPEPSEIPDIAEPEPEQGNVSAWEHFILPEYQYPLYNPYIGELAYAEFQ